MTNTRTRVRLSHRSHAEALRAFWELAVTLTLREIKTRYARPILGVYWAALSPLISATWLTVMVSFVARFDTSGAPYMLFVLAGLWPWTIFAQSINVGTGSIVANGALLHRVTFPRETLVVAAVASRFIDLAFSGLLLVVGLVLWKAPWQPALLWVPVLALGLVALALGVTLVTAALHVFIRDVQLATGHLLTILMYLSAVFYPVTAVPASLRPLFELNPVLAYVDAFRGILLTGQGPLASQVFAMLAVSGLALVGGYGLFQRLQPSFVEHL